MMTERPWSLRWRMPMHRPDEQATLERTTGYLGLGMLVLCLVGIPVIVFVPALRLAAGMFFFLMGLFAWVSHWAVHSS
jgi:hypothetical protein